MRRVAMVVLSLAVSACATRGPDYVITEHAVLPVKQAIGLTRAELSQRIGVKPHPQRLTTLAVMENDQVVETVPNSYLIGGDDCPNGGFVSLLWRHGEQVGPYLRDDRRIAPPALFRDGRYVGSAEDHARAGEDASLPAYLVTTCTEVRNLMNPGMAVLLPLVPVHVGLVAAFNAGKPELNDINPTLTSLSLGAPPPGGLDAWLANLPKDVLLLSREGAHTEVGVYAWKPLKPEIHRGYEAVKVTFEDGVVSRLEHGINVTCMLTPSRTFQCAQQG